MKRVKYYFVDQPIDDLDDEHCYTKEAILDAMKGTDIKELKVHTAKKDDVPDYFYCRAVQNIAVKGECGNNQCYDYVPRNGKSGICKHYGFFYEPDKELTFKI